MTPGAGRRVLRAALAVATLAVAAPVPGPAAGVAAAKPPACDSLAVSPAFALDRTALCLHVTEEPLLGTVAVPTQPPPRRVVVRVTRDGGRTWRDARALGLSARAPLCTPSTTSVGSVVCAGGTSALQVLFSASYAADRTAYVALNDRGLFQTTDLGETFVPADPQAGAACCSSFWLEPFRRPGTETDPTPRAPLAMTDGGSACSEVGVTRTAEVLPPVHRVVVSPSKWPVRFLAPGAAFSTPVFLLGHHCVGTLPDMKVTSRLYACDLQLACTAAPLYAFPRRLDDVVAGGDHAKRGSLYATATYWAGNAFRVALYRSLSGGRTWQALPSVDAAIGPGEVQLLDLAPVPRSAVVYAWAYVYANDTTRHVLLRSADHGAHWTRVAVSGSRGLPWNGADRTIPTTYYQPSHLTIGSADRMFFLGTLPGLVREERSGGSAVHRVWCSADGGRTWAASCP